MRINIYSQELTDVVIIVKKHTKEDFVFYGVRLMLHSTTQRNAVTFWLPSAYSKRIAMSKAFKKISDFFADKDIEYLMDIKDIKDIKDTKDIS